MARYGFANQWFPSAIPVAGCKAEFTTEGLALLRYCWWGKCERLCEQIRVISMDITRINCDHGDTIYLTLEINSFYFTCKIVLSSGHRQIVLLHEDCNNYKVGIRKVLYHL